MSSATIVSSSDLTATERIDPSFHALRAKHLPLVQEFLSKFSLEELCQLALDLPFDAMAASAVFRIGFLTVVTQAAFEQKVKTCGNCAQSQFLTKKRAMSDLAVYCAAASQYSYVKMLTRLLELKEREKEEVEKIAKLTRLAKSKDCNELLIAINPDKQSSTDIPADS